MICVSIAPQNMSDARILLKEAAKYSDLIEIRVENIADLNLEKLLRGPRPKVVITNRTNNKYTEQERIKVFKNSISLGADYIDVEIETGKKIISNIKSLIRNTKSKTNIIISSHNYQRVPDNLEKIYSQIKKYGPDIIKIIYHANNIIDNIKIFHLLELARRERRKLITFCLGEKGEISRILAPRFGSVLTYCSLKEGRETATGQIPVKKMLNVFNYNLINKKTRIFGLAGNPVSQSKGIYVHNEFFRKKKVNAVYLNFLVDDFSQFIKVYTPFLSGLSITIPYKESAARIVDKISDEAKEIKSVNTILKKNKELIGYNTDALAIEGLLKKYNLKNKNAAILGTGGTARTAIYIVKKLGGRPIIFGRNIDKAKQLADEFNCLFYTFEEVNAIVKSGKTNLINVIINTTSIGMAPNEKSIPLNPKFLKSNHLVVDFVYTPSKTLLLKSAVKKDCKIISGTEIFYRQARLQQELFLSIC